MPIWVIGVLALAVGLVALIVVAGRRQQQTWLARAEALRALALRRNASADASPGDPASVLPMRDFKTDANIRRVEIPVVVRGRAQDVEYRIFDVLTAHMRPVSKDRTPQSQYESWVTLTRPDSSWPRFEFVALAEIAENSLTARLIEAAGSLAEHTRFKGLTHVPIPHRQGFQLFVADPAKAPILIDVLMKTFEHGTGWSVATLDRTIALSKSAPRAMGMAALVPVADLDAFLDDAIGLERGLRTALQ